MHGVDIGVAALLGLGFWRGRKHGLGNEVYRLVRLALPVAGGCGLYSLISSAVGAIPVLGSDSAGLVGFLGGIGVTFALFWKARSALKRWIEARFGDARRTAAGVIGVARGAIMALALVTGIELSPVDGLTEASLSGRTMSALFDRAPGDEATPAEDAPAEDAPAE